MGGGQGSGAGSWYASVGGKSRLDFSGVVDKALLGKLGQPCEEQSLPLSGTGWRAAVFPVDPSMTMEFVARNVERGMQQ